MIISSNKKPSLTEFHSLVTETNNYLNWQASKNESYFLGRGAQKLEDDVTEALSICSDGTPFKNTIFKISGKHFPDIVAGRFYGVEVKSSCSNNWITLGGSINESTRVVDVERIVLTFGKLVSPVEFISRPYEDCLSEVVVTHYPRYKIDMTLNKGETFFDKLGVGYDDLRMQENPVRKVVQYYKSQLKEGESLWWIDTDLDESLLAEQASMSVRLWRTLPAERRHDLMISGLAFFPEILSNSSTKYERFSLWLASHHGVVSTSMRDAFTAGGQGTILVGNTAYDRIPQVLLKVYRFSDEITMKLLMASDDNLKEFWRIENLWKNRVSQWIDIVSSTCFLKNHDVRTVLSGIFNQNLG